MTIDILSLSATEERQLRLIHIIGELARKSVSTQASMDLVMEEMKKSGLATTALSSDLDDMKVRGEVEFFDTLGDLDEVIVLQPGFDRADLAESTRTSVVARKRLLRDAYLRWMYSGIDLGTPVGPEAYLASAPSILGHEYSLQEIQLAGAWLKENGYISGQSAWGHPAPIRPQMTPRGEAIVEQNRSVNDEEAAALNTFNTLIHGNANVANASNHFSQSQTIHQTWVDDGRRLAQAIAEALPGLQLSPDANEALTSCLDEAEKALEGTPDPRRARRVFNKVNELLLSVGLGVLAGVLSDQVKIFLQQLPT